MSAAVAGTMFRPTPSYTTLWDVTYGEFGRVWADGALRLPNAELFAGLPRMDPKRERGAPSRRQYGAHPIRGRGPAALKRRSDVRTLLLSAGKRAPAACRRNDRKSS